LKGEVPCLPSDRMGCVHHQTFSTTETLYVGSAERHNTQREE
jgi:hypothetical protein